MFYYYLAILVYVITNN